ncbi:conserved hypothetical protein [Candidatus Zixiibacteriota bacterium]|nr:conserved hypothetical protein [candidate division Zixibacteria bacterium]
MVETVKSEAKIALEMIPARQKIKSIKIKTMSYFAICSFDLKNASYQDYQNAYYNLRGIGLTHNLAADDGTTVQLPTTMIAGQLTATSASSLRDDLSDKIHRAFKTRGFTSEIFVAVGGDWAWGHRTT